MGKIDLRPFIGPEQLADSAAADCLELISGSAVSAAAFTLALSGGRIARTFCSAFTARAKQRKTDLDHVHFFWSDERCVPPEDPESNFHLANEALLKPLAIGDSHIHRIRGEMDQPESFAQAEAALRRLAPVSTRDQPILDLVLLGMGEDGHIASLFPAESEQAMRDPAVFRAVRAVKPPPLRITMGYGVLAVAKNVWVLASGAGKADALSQSLTPGGRTPLARLLQMRTLMRIYSDIQSSPPPQGAVAA